MATTTTISQLTDVGSGISATDYLVVLRTSNTGQGPAGSMMKVLVSEALTNLNMPGTANVAGNFSVGTTKFSVTAATGNVITAAGLFNNTTDLTLGAGGVVGLTINFSTRAVVAAATITSPRLIAGTDVSTSIATAVFGDATATDSLGFNTPAQVLGLDSRKSNATATGDYLHAHLLSKQTVATTGSIQGLETWTWASHTSGTVAKIISLLGNAEVSGVGGTTTQVTCVTGGLVCSGGTVTTVESGKFGGTTVTGASSTITTAVGVRILAATVASSGTLTNLYGLKIDAQDAAATLNWTIYCASSTTSGGVTFRDSALATTATLGDVFIPSCAGVPTGVPANIPTGQIAIRYDSNANKIWFYNGGWKGVLVS